MIVGSLVSGGVPEGSRTPDPWFRKPVLYPAELPGQSVFSVPIRYSAATGTGQAHDPFAVSTSRPSN